ncbi:MAG TPA: NADH-ubiquinone oxidoreductase-F iron-sulfur binding region domain-containing protein [Dehalococcoidia bacterium]|nr:NADH-ubiquinone oxidoreductase-F iron-sulfur binding region domain-containing protein [Dehalococcoidia bacterium]
MTAYLDLRAQAEAAWATWSQPGKPRVLVNDDTSARGQGSRATFAALEAGIAQRGLDLALQKTGSRGLHYADPVVEVIQPDGASVLYGYVVPERVGELLDALAAGNVATALAIAVVQGPDVPGVPRLEDLPFWKGQVRRLMERCGVIDPDEIDHYLAQGGYAGLARALNMSDEEVIKETLDSGIWGRGGAAFPTGRKWDFLRTARGEPKYLICNADEGDPGAFVNRMLMEGDPHLVVEGMIIGAKATGASYGYIYIRDEYDLAVDRMTRALDQARERGLLGENILGSGLNYDMEVFRGAGAYVCGEETGLISSIDDDRGMPRIRPPFPAQSGVHAKPTNVNNVESYANVPLVFRHNVAWYRQMGTERNAGTKMFSLSGDIERVGVLEVPFGTTLGQVVNDMGGGVPNGVPLKAIQSGGPLGGILPARAVELSLEPEPFRAEGVLLGSGGLILVSEERCIVDLCIYFLWFAEDESCGRCTTCHGGTQRMVEILERIASGGGRRSDIDNMHLLARTLQWSNCVHGSASPAATETSLTFFRDEYDAHIDEKRCPAHVCAGLIQYEVVQQTARLPEAADICPTDAFQQQDGAWQINPARCIRCGACRDVAPEAIHVVDRLLPVQGLPGDVVAFAGDHLHAQATP